MTEGGARPVRMSGLVVDQFLELVATGQLRAGERLPPERDLAQQFAVGRNSVREALRVLEVLGVVESRHGDGTYVRAPDSSQLMLPFRLVLGLSGADAALEDVLTFRRIVEPASAALAAERLDEPSRIRLEASLRRFEGSIDPDETRTPDAAAADTDFHFAIALATRNQLIIGVQRALLDVMQQFRHALEPSSYTASQRVARGHHPVFGAILARDPDAARDAMAQHLEDVAAALPRTAEPTLATPAG